MMHRRDLFKLGGAAAIGAVVKPSPVFADSDVQAFMDQFWWRPGPVQRTLLKLIYHQELDSTKRDVVVRRTPFSDRSVFNFTEAEYLRYLYEEGRANIREQDHERQEFVGIVGRRSGKDMLAVFLASFETHSLLQMEDPQGHYNFPGRLHISTVGVNKDLTGQLLIDFGHAIRHHGKQSVYNTLTHMNFEARNGKTIRASFKSSKSKSLRGYGTPAVILNDVALYGEDEGQEVYDACKPGVEATSGRIATLSVPGQFGGPLHHRYLTPDSNTIAVRVPTWEMNIRIPADFYRSRPMDTFRSEYGAEFV